MIIDSGFFFLGGGTLYLLSYDYYCT